MQNCPNCGHENPEDTPICLNCATTLQRICPNCGTKVPPGNKYCGQCGERLADRSRGQVSTDPKTIAQSSGSDCAVR
jgi:uncharacterized membrane protein YvbJ